MASKKTPALFKHISREQFLGIAFLLVLVVMALVLSVMYKPGKTESVRLSAEVLQAYAEANELAVVYGNPDAAIKRLDMEFAGIPNSSRDEKDLYTRAKLTIYKADILITYGDNFEKGFALLGDVYSAPLFSDSTRSEALALAMAHAVQGLEEGRFTAQEIRDHVLLDKNFKSVLDVGLADAMLIDSPLDTYKYLARGFAIAMDLTPSEKVYALSESYSLRLASPFVIPPPTGGYYYGFIASVENFESRLDQLVNEYAEESTPYQEYVATSYYNVARAYEAAPKSDISIVDDMARTYDKLEAYVIKFPDSAQGAYAYLTSINTRLICKAADEADFDSANIDLVKLQPYLDSLYEAEGWVVPCKEAFEFISRDIDTRFAKYF